MKKQSENNVRELFKRTQLHTEKYSINVNGVEIWIFPNVFSPAYFTDSQRFSEVVPKIVEQKKFLEIGTGTGIVALFCGLNGGEISVSDSNSDAVKNAEYNFQQHNLNAKSYCGDMFESIPDGEKFDAIFWNHPFNW